MSAWIHFLAVCMLVTTACGPAGPADGRFASLPSTLDPRNPDGSCPAWPPAEGFYKDIFVDGGYGSEAFVPYAVESLCLEMDALLLGLPGQDMSASEMISEQNALIIGNPNDLNGILLYPDESPRFRLIFVNGSGWISHGESLGEEGRERYRTFYYNGGSYTGSCAGAFFATANHCTISNEPWLGIWPGVVESGGEGLHSIIFDDIDHPLVQKYPSLYQDGVVKSVKPGAPVFGGKYGTIPPGTELIGRPDFSGYQLSYLQDKKPDSKEWEDAYVLIAYKDDENSGRMVLSSGHPEYTKGGEVQEFTEAIFLYAMDGNRPIPRIKGSLENGQPVDMRGESDAVGDRQYHRWTFELPEGVTRLSVSTETTTHDVAVYLSRDCPAHRELFQYGPEKDITVVNPQAGPWHLSVYGNHDHPNGAPYVLTASWE